jgi:hypothetical protein
MHYSETFYNHLRALIRSDNWDGWYQHHPELDKNRRDVRWRVYCGDGRYDENKKNALFAKTSGIALNFQIVGEGDSIRRYEFCVAWPHGWRLMYHWDPKQAQWPTHPEYHIQFDPPRPNTEPSLPPFMDWRLPFAEKQPERVLEYLISHITSIEAPT